METTYQKEYKEIYNGHWWYQAREWGILQVIHSLYKGKPLKILEIGCGPGLLLPKLFKYGDVEGIEPSDSVFEYDEMVNSIVHRISFPSETQNFPSDHYDLVLLLDVLEHIRDDETAIHEVKRLLKSGGNTIITVPAFMSLWGPHDLVNHHFRRYTLPEISSLLNKAGLNILWKSYFFGWCFIPIWVVRRIRRITQKQNPKHDFKIPNDWLNTLLKNISCLEFKFFQKKKLPLGTSLIIVGVK